MSRQTCTEICEDLIAYLDRRLEAGRAAEVDRHLAECAECRGTAEEHREVWKLLDQYDPLPVAPGFLQKVLARIGLTRTRGMARRIGGLWVAAAAALLLVALPLGVDFFRPGRDGGDPTPEEIEASMHIEMLENLEVLRAMDLLGETDDPAVMKTAVDLGEEVF